MTSFKCYHCNENFEIMSEQEFSDLLTNPLPVQVAVVCSKCSETCHIEVDTDGKITQNMVAEGGKYLIAE
jgi:hypothetical protein